MRSRSRDATVSKGPFRGPSGPLPQDRSPKKEIAAVVFLSDTTVKNDVSSIPGKLDLERRGQAAPDMAKLNADHQR